MIISFMIFPLLGVIFYQTNGLIGGFIVGCVSALIAGSLIKSKDEPQKRAK